MWYVHNIRSSLTTATNADTISSFSRRASNPSATHLTSTDRLDHSPTSPSDQSSAAAFSPLSLALLSAEIPSRTKLALQTLRPN